MEPPIPQPILRTKDLTKRYGRRTAVDRLDLALYPGEVFGFLGPNGAGKTTTIRMLLNLVRPTAGEIWLFGQRLRDDPAGLLRRVGALIESPSFQPYLSGRQNLQVVARYTAAVPRGRIDEVLDLIGLSGRADDRFATYSLGMKQRLGIGAAVLLAPELVILDEPTNGLDPAGIVEMRELIRRLGGAGTTVLVSSHILAEIRQVATRIGIIRGGRFVAIGATDDILATGERWEILGLPAADVRRAMADLTACHTIESVRGGVAIRNGALEGRAIIRALTRADLYPDQVRRSNEDLESIFLSLTEREAGL